MIRDGSSSKDQKIFVKNEISIRKKALASPDFPNEALIDEYLNNKESIGSFSVDWTQPNIIKFVVSITLALNLNFNLAVGVSSWILKMILDLLFV